MRYFPPGDGEVEVKDNNRGVKECRTQRMGGRDEKINSRAE